MRVEDHTRRTIPTLKGIVRHKGLLNGMQLITLDKAFDRGHLPTLEASHLQGTGLLGPAIHQDRTGTTVPPTASEFGAGQIEIITKYPEERPAAVHRKLDVLAV
jgi:hypothetical protein